MNFNQFKEKLFQRYLVHLFRPGRLKKYLKKELLAPTKEAGRPKDKEHLVRVAALQVKLELFKDPLLFAQKTAQRVAKAKSKGAQIVVFPEYNSLPLFGLLPGIERVGEESSSLEPPKEDLPVSPGQIFAFMTPAIMPFIDTLFSSLAKAYEAYIMAGSYPLLEEGRLLNRAFLYGPTGRLIGSQDKVHLMPMEEEWQMARGSFFKSFETSVGCLGMPVCMDATYFETFRALEALGVEIALLPIANLEHYNYWLALRGLWPRVQESTLYGVKSALVGAVAGLTFTGRAAIYAPLKLTPARDGVLAETKSPFAEDMVIADLDLQALKNLRELSAWRDTNPAISKKLSEAYRLI